MVGSLLHAAAGKAALALLGGATALGGLGATGSLPGPLQPAFDRGMRVVVPSNVAETDIITTAGTKVSIGSAATVEGSSESDAAVESHAARQTDTALQGAGVGVGDLAALDLGVDLAFAGETGVSGAYQAAAAHIEHWCSQALGMLPERSGARATVMGHCTRALARAERQRSRLDRLMARTPVTSPPRSATEQPVPVHAAPPGRDDTPEVPPTPDQGVDAPPVGPEPPASAPAPPRPEVPRPEAPSSDPHDPEPAPDTDDSGPGSGWDPVEEDPSSEGLSALIGRLPVLHTNA